MKYPTGCDTFAEAIRSLETEAFRPLTTLVKSHQCAGTVRGSRQRNSTALLLATTHARDHKKIIRSDYWLAEW